MLRRLAAILAADVVGYASLIQRDEAGTLAALRDRRKSILAPLVALHKGRIVKLMGDGVLVEFASAFDAVQCAVALQQKMAETNIGLEEARAIVFRIGINLSDVAVEGDDLYGDGVNIAARLEGIAEPGTICLSGTVYEQVKGKLNLDYQDLGRRPLKNIAEPVQVFLIRVDDSRHNGKSTLGELSLPAKPSIAVLPFHSLSDDPEQEYFADGMVEEIITALSRMRWLFVIARNSSFTYKGRAVDIKQVGRELGVRYVLEGSVRKVGDRVRISGQLIDAATGVHLWADRFDGPLANIFDLQDQVTARVVGALAPRLEQAEIERAKRKPTESLDAYDYYLRGIAAVHRWTREGNDEALAMFRRAIELDPAFSSAYGMAARSYSQRRAGGWLTDRAAEIAEAEYFAHRAAELGRDDAVALCTAGFALAYVVHDLENGAALVERGVQLNLNLSWGWLFSGWIQIWLGDPENGLEHVSRAMRLSPQDPQIFDMQTAAAYAHFHAGRYDEAISWAKKALRERPHYPHAMRVFVASLGITGNRDEASTALARLREIDPRLRLSNLKEVTPRRRPEDFNNLAEGLRKAGLPE